VRSKVVNWIGSFLLIVGVGILMGVGISYALGLYSTPTPHWSSAQINQGQALAKELRYQNTHLFKATRQQQWHGYGHRVHRRRATIQPGSEPAIRIAIPKIAVDAPVIETRPVNGEWQVADWAIGHLQGTANPGENGNMAVAAHDDIKGEIFKQLGKLSPGDKVFVYTRHAIYTYVVVGQQVVDPSDSAVLDPTTTPTLTMITCTPYWVDSQRLIVTAVLKSFRLR
jgi:LPXTG-site transpeptidase (sortase) family protein